MRAKKDKQQTPPAADNPFSFGNSDASVPGQQQAQDTGVEKVSAEGSVFGSTQDTNIGPDYGHRRSLRGGHDEVSVYNAQMRKRYAMDPRKRTTIILLIAAVILIPLTAVLPTNLLYGGSDASVAQLGASFGGRINALSQIGSGSAAGMAMAIYLIQIVAVAIAGAGLALNGAVYQGSLKNALASPSTLGIMSGATIGSVFYTLFIMLPSQETQDTFMRASELVSYLDSLDPFAYFWLTQARALCSLGGCAVAVIIVLGVAFIAGRGHMSKVGLLISGQVFTAVINSVVEMVRLYIRDHGTDAQMTALRSAVGGSFDSMTGLYQLLFMAVPVVIGIILVLAMRNRLNLLAFDDDEARSMGISANGTRALVIIICTVLTAVIVSYVGAVGFVGFIVPHLARKMVGPDFRYYIPASVCLGAVYLLVAYYLMNMLGILQGSIGTFTSIIGVIFFIVVAVRQRARGNADWI